MQSGPILFVICKQVQYFIAGKFPNLVSLFSHLFAFLNYLTVSNIPYGADHKFTEQQSVVSDETRNRQRWHTECQNSLTVRRRLLPRCTYLHHFSLKYVYSWFLPRNLCLKVLFVTYHTPTHRFCTNIMSNNYKPVAKKMCIHEIMKKLLFFPYEITSLTLCGYYTRIFLECSYNVEIPVLHNVGGCTT